MNITPIVIGNHNSQILQCILLWNTFITNRITKREPTFPSIVMVMKTYLLTFRDIFHVLFYPAILCKSSCSICQSLSVAIYFFFINNAVICKKANLGLYRRISAINKKLRMHKPQHRPLGTPNFILTALDLKPFHTSYLFQA